MKQLKVISEFRDKHNFLLNHEVGETLYIDDEKRAARLVELGLCELVTETDHTLVNEEAESEAIDEVAAAVDETQTEEETSVEEETPVEEEETAAVDPAPETEKEAEPKAAPKSKGGRPKAAAPKSTSNRKKKGA